MEKRKMIIAVDWHDTLQNYSPKFIRWYANRYGVQLPADADGKSFAELGITTMETDFRDFAQTGVLADLENVEGAQWAIRQLSGYYEVVLVSASGFALVHEETLRENFPDISAVLATNDKPTTCRLLGAKYLIDDLTRNFNGLPYHCEGIAYTQVWNKDFKGFRGQWKQIVHYLTQ